ncbi:hypothetical protein L9F63_023130 [Diploptera punctata]|uniref:Uncharacterized protein n=1 Tax=Diploptera punctata TaxID=6984 RepID=A0AAD7ZJ78_DIPPU|nr:hypothetical protein L9F63_023130 [Diploptera punctata]
MPFLECNELNGQIPHHRSKRDLPDITIDTIRDIIKNGIPALNIATLDPLTLPDKYDLELPPASGFMTVNELHLENITLTGLESFVSNNKFNYSLIIYPMSATMEFDLSFFLNVKADYLIIRILFGDLIPLYGGGAFELNTDNLRLRGKLDIDLTTPVTVTTMDVDVSADSTTFDISNSVYTEGAQYAKTFNRVMSGTTQIFGNSLDGLVENFKDLVNNYTKENNISLDDLLA